MTARPIAADRIWRGLALLAAYGLPVFFILLPLCGFLVYSLFWVEGTELHYDLTLVNYRRFFTDEIYVPVLRQTVILCLEVAALCIAFGYPVAYFLSGLKGRKKYMLLMLLLVGLMAVPYHLTLALPSLAGAGRSPWVFAGMPVALAVAALAVWLPMRAGVRTLRRMEF